MLGLKALTVVSLVCEKAVHLCFKYTFTSYLMIKVNTSLGHTIANILLNRKQNFTEKILQFKRVFKYI